MVKRLLNNEGTADCCARFREYSEHAITRAGNHGATVLCGDGARKNAVVFLSQHFVRLLPKSFP